MYLNIQKRLDDLKDKNISITEFLEDVNVSEDDYIKSVRSSIDGPKVFLKREGFLKVEQTFI